MYGFRLCERYEFCGTKKHRFVGAADSSPIISIQIYDFDVEAFSIIQKFRSRHLKVIGGKHNE